MVESVARLNEGRVDRPTRERLEGDRTHELRSRPRQDDIDLRRRLREQPRQPR
jgi:hypothetical protein